VRKIPNITVIGSYAVGMTMVTGRLPVAGETSLGHDFTVLHGGKGSNQAIAAARLGSKVHFVSCIGRDAFGESALELYKEEGIDSTGVKRSQTLPTGVGFVIVNESGENSIVIDFGACNDIDPEDIERLEPVIKQSDIVVLQLEICLRAVIHSAQRSHALGVPILLNPAPFQKIPEELFALCDYITPNETEARLLCGLKPDEPLKDEEVARMLLDKGSKNVIITLGAEGALILNREQSVRVGGIRVEVKDTTGAGDTFSAALATALSAGQDLVSAVRFANFAGALSVTRYGVVPSIPFLSDVEELMKKENAL